MIGLSQPGLANHLRNTVANLVAIDQPGYADFRAIAGSAADTAIAPDAR